MGDIQQLDGEGLRVPRRRTCINRHAVMAVAVLLLAGIDRGFAQDYQGTEEQRAACTPDVFRLCALEIPYVDRIVGCLKKQRPQLSAGCRAVFDLESDALHIAAGGLRRHHTVADRHFVHHRRAYERTEAGQSY